MDCWIIAQLSTPLPASEGSGDSESGMEFADDHGLLFMQGQAAADDDDDDNNNHDDDAESCSYDSYGRAQEHVSDDDGESDGDDDGAHGADEEEVFVWLPENVRAKIKEEKEVKVVDSEEDDRLFWEACLATGY